MNKYRQNLTMKLWHKPIHFWNPVHYSEITSAQVAQFVLIDKDNVIEKQLWNKLSLWNKNRRWKETNFEIETEIEIK